MDARFQDPVEEVVFATSRRLYRRLAVALPPSTRAQRQVLDACETTMRRLHSEPHFARPGRFLFESVRAEFPLGEQLWVRRMVDFHVELARGLLRRVETTRECGAFTRSGAPCRRAPVNGGEYCPSHRHLELQGAIQGDGG